jgi:hypothetical protein
MDQVLQESLTFAYHEQEWQISFHVYPKTVWPYVLMPIGTTEDGFYVWDRAALFGIPVIGAAPGTSLMALWRMDQNLWRINVETDEILGPSKFAPILDTVESLFHLKEI